MTRVYAILSGGKQQRVIRVQTFLAYATIGSGAAVAAGMKDRHLPLSKSMTTAGAVLLMLCLTACGGVPDRTAHPVQMKQPGDEQLSCAGIKDESLNNLTAANTLLQQHGVFVDNRNQGRIIDATMKHGLSGLLMATLLAKIPDMSNVEQVEARALIDRNERLTLLAQSKGCDAS